MYDVCKSISSYLSRTDEDRIAYYRERKFDMFMFMFMLSVDVDVDVDVDAGRL